MKLMGRGADNPIGTSDKTLSGISKYADEEPLASQGAGYNKVENEEKGSTEVRSLSNQVVKARGESGGRLFLRLHVYGSGVAGAKNMDCHIGGVESLYNDVSRPTNEVLVHRKTRFPSTMQIMGRQGKNIRVLIQKGTWAR